MDNRLALVIGMFFLGIVAQIIAPFIKEKIANPNIVFDWSYTYPRILAGLMTIAYAVATQDFSEIASMDWQLALSAGFSFAYVGDMVGGIYRHTSRLSQ